jgi:predicted phosphodiesterase
MQVTNTKVDIKTRFLIISDTHGLDSLPSSALPPFADVAIHCGDLTRFSKLEEYRASIRLLQSINAPLKLVIAGNHDFTMDIPVFERRVEEGYLRVEPERLEEMFGSYGEARRLFDETEGLTFLDEGTHSFRLENGALLKVYASAYTPATPGGWGFVYKNGHTFDIQDSDVVITHGPPFAVSQKGCKDLSDAIEKARPRLHCFGHIHGGWGAELYTWPEKAEEPAASVKIAELPPCNKQVNQEPVEFFLTSHCSTDTQPLQVGTQALFVNAAIQGTYWNPIQRPWVVDIELPPA